MADRPKISLKKITAEQQLSIALSENINMQRKLDEAIEIVKKYTNKDQLGQLTIHADEYLSKWGIKN